MRSRTEQNPQLCPRGQSWPARHPGGFGRDTEGELSASLPENEAAQQQHTRPWGCPGLLAAGSRAGEPALTKALLRRSGCPHAHRCACPAIRSAPRCVGSPPAPRMPLPVLSGLLGPAGTFSAFLSYGHTSWCGL